jgi:hypothetical protein
MANLSRTQQQTAMLGQLLKTAGGRQKLAASLGPSLRRRRDYMSIARKALMVETLPDGALPIYDKEFDTAAMTVGSTPGSLWVKKAEILSALLNQSVSRFPHLKLCRTQ